MDRYMKAPLDREEVKTLRAGDYVYITGTIYTARDAAHLRMSQALDKGEKLPIELEGNVIYYMGPTPAREGRPIGSAGPTTASRMDKYTPRLLDLGLTAMIGKGKRKPEVTEAIVRNGAVFFAAVGGAGALLSKCIKKAEVIAYALSACGIEDRSGAVMVGDREHDVAGARKEGLPCIGVLYGFGSREELEKAGAERIISRPEELCDLI